MYENRWRAGNGTFSKQEGFTGPRCWPSVGEGKSRAARFAFSGGLLSCPGMVGKGLYRGPSACPGGASLLAAPHPAWPPLLPLSSCKFLPILQIRKLSFKGTSWRRGRCTFRFRIF